MVRACAKFGAGRVRESMRGPCRSTPAWGFSFRLNLCPGASRRFLFPAMNPTPAGGVIRLEAGLEQTDEDLVGGVIRGEQEAFASLFERYRIDVRRHLRAIIRDDAAADDLTQEVFLRLWRRAEQWKGEAAFRSWLLRIATNLALNHLRTVKRRREQPIQPVPSAEDDEDESAVPTWMIDAATLRPDEALAQTERRHLLRQVVGQLSEEKQVVFRMVYDARMETRQVATKLGIPEGTVKSRLYHARQQIARSWRDLGIEWEDFA